MLNDFESIKAKLIELADVINKFKSKQFNFEL